MKYTMDGRVRYSEVDENRNLTVEGIVNYMQDTCMMHSETLGVGLDHLQEKGVSWILSSWQIQIKRVPKVFDKIRIETNPYEFKGFFGYRNFGIYSEDGEVLVQANSIFVYLDMEKMIPMRIPSEESDAYAPFEPRTDMEYAPRKMKLPEDFLACEPIPVNAGMIDTNRHVNNCQYIRTAIEVAQLSELPREIRVEYRKQARMGDVFYPFISRSDKEIVVDLRNEAGESFAPVMFIL